MIIISAFHFIYPSNLSDELNLGDQEFTEIAPLSDMLDKLLGKLSADQVPQFCVAIDGKPSDRFTRGKSYCLALLFATNMNKIIQVGEQVNQLIRANGFELKKLSAVRNRRKEKYTISVLDALIELSETGRGLRFNWHVNFANSDAMRPDLFLSFLRDTEHFSLRAINAKLRKDSVEYTATDGKLCTIKYSELGGIVFWYQMLVKLQTSADIDNADGRKAWSLHMDRLPLDHNFRRTQFFSRFIDNLFNQKVWFSFTSGKDFSVDILCDFFANIYFDKLSNNPQQSQAVKDKIETLERLNTREYWTTR